MGYTHYWNHENIDAETWKTLQTIARKILREAQDTLGIALSEEYDINRTPVINAKEIRFNGYADEGHETFYLTPGACSFEFCKTARKPYDAVVVAMLQACAVYCTSFDWRSDGDPEEHADGVALYNAATGANWDHSNASIRS